MSVLDVLSYPYKPANGTLALDLNHWLGKPDFDVMEDRFFKLGYAPVVINKATDFWAGTAYGFVDDTADRFYRETTRRGWRNGFFHWLQPKTDPTVQAKYFVDYWLAHPTWMRPIVDFEDRNVNSSTDYLWRLQVCLQYIEDKTGVVPIIYTGKGFMDTLFGGLKNKVGFLKKYPLWLAWYSAWKPQIPYPWTWNDMLMWQYSAKGDYPYYKNPGTNAGELYGVESPSLDMDWVMMPYDQMDVLSCGVDYAPVVTEPEVEPVKVVDYTGAVMVASSNMRLRSKPDLSASSQIGSLQVGDSVEVTGMTVQENGYNWLPIKYTGYVALSRIGAESAPFFTVKE